MVPIADGRLAHLDDQGLRIAQQDLWQHAAAVERLPQRGRIQAIALSRALNHCPARARAAAHVQGRPDDAFMADDGYLRRVTVAGHIEQRDDGGCRKKHVRLLASGFAKNLPELEVDGVQRQAPPLPHGLRHRGKEVVGTRLDPGRIHGFETPYLETERRNIRSIFSLVASQQDWLA